MNIQVDKSVEKFVPTLEKLTISKFSKLTNLLEEFGNLLSMPYSKKISRNLFELRIRGKQEVRIFYTFQNGNAVLLHGFVKKTQKTPRKEIEIALDKLISLR